MIHESLFKVTSYVLLACLAVTTVPLRGEDVLAIDPAYRQPNQRGEDQEAVPSSDSRQVQRDANLRELAKKKRAEAEAEYRKKKEAAGPPDVRGLRWLWSMDQVKEAENIVAAPIQISKNVQVLKGNDKIAGCPASLDFHFYHGELVRIECILDGKGLPDAYAQINEAMRAKYGKGMNLLEKQEAHNPRLSNEEKYVLANLMLMADVVWYSSPRTEVDVGRRAGRSHVRVCYTPNFAVGKSKESQRSKELEDIEKKSDQESQKSIREKL